MAVSEYHLDTRIRRRHIPLISQQRRLRHLRSVSVRNITAHDSEEVEELSVQFTLHKVSDSAAFYTSEVIQDGLNASWKDFESSNFPDYVDTATSYVFVKVWNVANEKQLLIEWLVFFSGLVFLGEQIPKEGKNFKPNSLIFGMSEGYYGCSDSYQLSMNTTSDTAIKETLDAEMAGLRTSYTLSTLSRIKTVERAIKQTEANVQRRRNSINTKLKSYEELRNIHSQQELLKIRISVLKSELHYKVKHFQFLEKDISQYKSDVSKKRYEISKKVEDQKTLLEKCYEMTKSYCKFRELFLKTEAQLNLRRKQLISELSCIYPVDEFPDHKGFSIHNVHLPNSENFAGHDDTMIAVALGYVCHIVLMISQFLNIPLRYSINFYGSRSSIIDHITSSLPEKTREFPLHLKGKDKKCFEYGVFLLNKNIGQLRIYCRLNTKDLSATLPNLSSLIELRMCLNSDTHPATYPANPSQSHLVLQSDSTVQNGVSDFLKRSPTPDLTSNSTNNNINNNLSEVEHLRREMEAMMPSQTPPLIPKDSALSSSLDKGLNDIRLIERSLESEKTTPKPKLLKEASHHHSSYPNLNAVPHASESLESHLVPPNVYKAENSHNNSEEEPLEDSNSSLPNQRPSLARNDSIFYIPSVHDENATDGQTNSIAASNIISEDLSLRRTEEATNGKSSFQMQSLSSESKENEDPESL